MAYAVVLGEALVDLLERQAAGEIIYRQAIGGGPLNVAVGVARLGGSVEFAGAVGDDVLGDRIVRFLAETGVGTGQLLRAPVPTTLAVASFDGAEPQFHFYGEPPSYAMFTPEHLKADLVRGAAVLYCGSIALLRAPSQAAAREAWRLPGPLRVFDPNIRPRLLPDAAAVAAVRALVEEFASTADLVKLSVADAHVLYPGLEPEQAATHLQKVGAAAVVLTLGPDGALVRAGGESLAAAAPLVAAVDATGAGDAVMAALIAQLLVRGSAPVDAAGWVTLVRFATAVAGLVCERPGGATAMPALAEVYDRFPDVTFAAG